jgi:hypothetical protein
MDKLSAEEYREALILVLAELEDLPAPLTERHQLLAAVQRLGRLKLHIATIVGTVSPPMEPVYGLRALRHGRERPSGPDHEVMETGLARDDQEEVVPDERP